ncbi:DNA repair exonuclease [Vagococcus coleopterorum]|uniref:DNA repair exonuclease n=1 Tax=Vagococcus coleopterorum TaxID=2714946 RepID=A0A6G8AKU7_9ENTE|nr:DNA repair exonuclease [Vagococcus coleopterorum]QIL45714.1 DNA repair exonuclease [Vagococcus coleopterorum]
MKFIHCADLHLDQPFQGLGKLSSAFSNKLVDVNAQVFNSLIETAIEERVDFLLIVGDTFHQAKPSIQTQQLFVSGLEKLNQEGIPVYLTFGNHDYYQAEKYWFKFPKNTYLFNSEEIETKTLSLPSGETVAISAFSYTSPKIMANKASEFPTRSIISQYHIGLYHGQVGRVNDHPYAPFQLGELQQLNYDYWALGHIHQPQLLSNEPLIIYPGSPVGHTKKETASRGCVLVENQGNTLKESWLELTDLIWETVVVDGRSATSLANLMAITEIQLKEFMQSQELLTCLEVQFQNLPAELASLVKEELASGELLLYLRELVAVGTDHQVWLYQVSSDIAVKPMQWPVGITKEMVLNQAMTYAEAEMFAGELSDLFKQSELQHLFSNNQDFINETIDKTVRHLGMTED